MNILTFDIEEWYLEKIKGGNVDGKYGKFDNILSGILDMLDAKNEKATFFCVGKMGSDFQHVVRKIYERGHEIGCHSNVHTWLNKMTEEECRRDTREAVDSLEQCVGVKVKSYRAPAFSVGKDNPWVFDIFAECGIERDSSIYPATRDFGGFPDFESNAPTLVTHHGVTIKEFPIAMTTILGRKMAFSGGGYFRLFPLWYIRREMKHNGYGMCYLHIADLMSEQAHFMTKKEYEDYFKETGTFSARLKRYIKANLGKNNAWIKLQKMVDSEVFVNLEEADSSCSWQESPKIQL